VSASPAAIVEAGLAAIDLHPSVIIAAESMRGGDRVPLEVDRPIPYGPGKVARLQARLSGRPLVAAFGDNRFDIPMLASARVPVAVRPKMRLRERAGEVAGLVELSSE
jgi:phosphoserine phosphatase